MIKIEVEVFRPVCDWGHAEIRSYFTGHVAQVWAGDERLDAKFKTFADAEEFIRHPFRLIDCGDFWNGSEVMTRQLT